MLVPVLQLISPVCKTVHPLDADGDPPAAAAVTESSICSLAARVQCFQADSELDFVAQPVSELVDGLHIQLTNWNPA
jgi:hypothetical protein